MPKIDAIVAIINNKLTAPETGILSGAKFQPQQINGIAYTSIDEAEETWGPVLLNDYDNNTLLTVDEEYALQIYHKQLSWNNGRATNQYKKTNKLYVSEYSMAMIIAANRRNLQMTADELNSVIIKGLPADLPLSELEPIGIKKIGIVPVGGEFNNLVVWSEEYQTNEFALKPSSLLFRLNYVVTMVYDASCIDEQVCN